MTDKEYAKRYSGFMASLPRIVEPKRDVSTQSLRIYLLLLAGVGFATVIYFSLF